MKVGLKKTLLSTLLFGVAVGFGSASYAAPISCDTEDASANGAYAYQCVGDNAVGANPAAELAFVNSSFPDATMTNDDFFFADKSEAGKTDAATNGFLLSVTKNTNANGEFLWLYTLTVPTEYQGLKADWVLGVKQASNSFIAYLFEDVTLGITGGYNSFWLNPNDKLVNDYSHSSGFLRIVSDNPPPPPPQGTPEPGMLLLMGAGLLGLGMARRRKTA